MKQNFSSNFSSVHLKNFLPRAYVYVFFFLIYLLRTYFKLDVIRERFTGFGLNGSVHIWTKKSGDKIIEHQIITWDY